MSERLPILCLSIAIGLTTLTCTDQGEVTSPVDPQFVKPAKTTPAEPKLEEFWVYESDDIEGADVDGDGVVCPGGQVIHVVVSGEFLWLETAVTQDHWFNGIRDFLVLSGSDEHYEQGDRGPVQPPTDWNTEGTMGHIDVCFTGERVDYVYPGGEIALSYFVDAPSTSVNADGADPFAFTVYAVTDEIKFKPNVSVRFRPTGVVVDGGWRDPDSEGVTVTNGVFHDSQSFDDVRSYAIYKAPVSDGFVSFESINLTASCQVTTSTVGRGKKATQVTQTTVTAEVAFGFGVHDEDGIAKDWPSDGFVWTEAHLRVSPEGEAPFFSGPQRRAFQSSAGLATYTWTTDGELADYVKVELLVDNLTLDTDHGHDDFIYDPGLNGVRTTAGWFDGVLWEDWIAPPTVFNVINDGRFPVAWPEAITVNCGQG